jgi:hypothetical protein
MGAELVMWLSFIMFSVFWYRILLHVFYVVLNGATTPLWKNKRAPKRAPWRETDLAWIQRFWRMTSTGWYPLTYNPDRSGQSDNPAIDRTAATIAFFLSIPTFFIFITP